MKFQLMELTTELYDSMNINAVYIDPMNVDSVYIDGWNGRGRVHRSDGDVGTVWNSALGDDDTGPIDG